MIDIDHFKNVNDNCGHAFGDEVLKGVATTLQRTLRECDEICRYGGEEFCIILPHIDVENAFVAAERFRKTVMESPFKGLQVTISLGVSSSTLAHPGLRNCCSKRTNRYISPNTMGVINPCDGIMPINTKQLMSRQYLIRLPCPRALPPWRQSLTTP